MNHKRLRFLILILALEASLYAALQSGSLAQKPQPVAPRRTGNVLAQFSFINSDSLKSWEEKVFKGKTVYQVLGSDDKRFLQSQSRDSSSGLYVKVNYDVTPGLELSWSWKAVAFPKKKEPLKLSNRGEDDFAARLYVIFPSSNFFKSDVIEYLWDENIPAGHFESSPYSERVKLFVIRSGPAPTENDGWVSEKRDIYEDYRKLFGKEPKKALGALALMSDSDNTGTTSEACFGQLALTMERTIVKK